MTEKIVFFVLSSDASDKDLKPPTGKSDKKEDIISSLLFYNTFTQIEIKISFKVNKVICISYIEISITYLSTFLVDRSSNNRRNLSLY